MHLGATCLPGPAAHSVGSHGLCWETLPPFPDPSQWTLKYSSSFHHFWIQMRHQAKKHWLSQWLPQKTLRNRSHKGTGRYIYLPSLLQKTVSRWIGSTEPVQIHPNDPTSGCVFSWNHGQLSNTRICMFFPFFPFPITLTALRLQPQQSLGK